MLVRMMQGIVMALILGSIFFRVFEISMKFLIVGWSRPSVNRKQDKCFIFYMHVPSIIQYSQSFTMYFIVAMTT